MSFKKRGLALSLALLFTLSSCGISGDDMNNGKNDSLRYTNARFIRAIQEGRLENMKECVEEGADINLFSPYTQSIAEYNSNSIPIVEAFNSSTYDNILYLIESGVKLDFIAEPFGNTGLMLPGDRSKLLEAMLEHGADINQMGANKYEGQTALDVLLTGCFVSNLSDVDTLKYTKDAVNLLLQRGAEVRSETLQYSLESHGGMIFSRELINQLLDHKKNTGINRTLENALLGMDAAVLKALQEDSVGDVDIAQLLLAIAMYGSKETFVLAEKKYKDQMSDEEIEQLFSKHLIWMAGYCGNVPVLAHLIEGGYDVVLPGSDGSTSVGTWICSGNQMNALRYWLENGDSVSELRRNEDAVSSLMISAAKYNNVETLDLLAENDFRLEKYGARHVMEAAINSNCIQALDWVIALVQNDPALIDGTDLNDMLFSALCHGIFQGTTKETVDHVLAYGVDINGYYGNINCLVNKIRVFMPQDLEYFLQKGVDFEIIDAIIGENGGYGPLMKASKDGDFNAMKLYVKYGANVNSTLNSYGKTVLMDSVGSKNITAFLLESGADPNKVDEKRKGTALLYAISWQKPDSVRLLLEAGADPTYSPDGTSSTLEIARSFKNPEVIALIQQGIEDWSNKEQGGINGKK